MEKGKRQVAVSALQFACTDDIPTNVATAERLVRAAHEKGASIILIQVPLVASNHVGKEIIETEHGKSEITFYGNSFLAGPTGEIVAAANDKEEAQNETLPFGNKAAASGCS